jgi:hypothetical protein
MRCRQGWQGRACVHEALIVFLSVLEGHEIINYMMHDYLNDFCFFVQVLMYIFAAA